MFRYEGPRSMHAFMGNLIRLVRMLGEEVRSKSHNILDNSVGLSAILLDITM